MEPPVPVGGVTGSGWPGDLGHQQRHPGQRRERQVILAPGRAGGVPVDEAGQGAAGPYGVPRRRIQMSDQKSRLPRSAGEPDGVCGRPECRGRVVQSPKPRTDLPERVVGAQPIWPCLGLAQGLAGQERQAFAALVIEAAGSRSAVEAGVFQMPQHRVHGRRPRLRGAADFVAGAYGSETASARAAVVRSSPGSTAIRGPRRPNNRLPPRRTRGAGVSDERCFWPDTPTGKKIARPSAAERAAVRELVRAARAVVRI